MRKEILLASTLLATRRVFAFASFPPNAATAAFYQPGFVARLVAASEVAAGQSETIKDDLGARDKDSAQMLPYWELTDDLIEGYDRVKAQGQKYLGKFKDEDDDDYKSRLEQSEMTNVYSDIIENLSGKPFEEPVSIIKAKDADGKEIEPPSEITEFIKDVDGARNNLTAFAAATFFNGINSAIDWIYVDYPKVDRERVRTMQDQKREGIRPYWSHVLGRNVLSCVSQIINSEERIVYMRILEPGSPNHIRIFEYTPDLATGGGSVNFALFREVLQQDGVKKEYVLVDAGPITIGVIPLVPFTTGRRDGRRWFFYPTMRAAADTQIQLYGQESGLKFAKVMTAYPMLAANGILPEKEADGKTPKKLRVGPNRVLYSQMDGNGNVGSWGYISPDAACLKFLADDVKDTMDQLRELGKQPLTAQSGNLTVITTAFAAGKTKTAVGAWGLRLGEALNVALQYTCLWIGLKDYTPAVHVYDEYDTMMDEREADLTALQSMRTGRDISQDNLIREMKRRDVLRSDFDPEENKKQLLEETPSDADLMEDDGATQPAKKPPVKK